MNAFSGTSYPEGPCLFVEASGSEELVQSDLELVQAIAREEGATELVHERDPDARARLWQARHDATHALAARFPGTKERATDVCVPLTELAGAVRFARSEIDRLGLNAGIVGHAGDGNLHVAIQVGPDPAEIERSEELVHNVVDDALARGGTCTGEHGIGLGKIAALAQEHGDLIPLMQAIKASFDPNGILNPGKVLPAGVGERAAVPARRRHRRHVHRRRAARRRTARCGPRRSSRRRTTMPAASSPARSPCSPSTASRPDEIADVVHASTVASNTILEGRGARTALVTTKGFRDVLEMRRLRIPVLYDIQYEQPPPLVPRRRRLRGRRSGSGRAASVWRELDEESVHDAAREIRERRRRGGRDRAAPLLRRRRARAAGRGDRPRRRSATAST